MPSFKSILLCGLVKPSNKTKEATESSSDGTPFPPPPPLAPRPSRKLRRNAWVYFRRPSHSSRSNKSSSSVDTLSFTAPPLPPLRRAAASVPSPTGKWSAYKTAREVAIRDDEERELRQVRERERSATESEERERELRARRRIEGQRESREVEEWFKQLMAQW